MPRRMERAVARGVRGLTALALVLGGVSVTFGTPLLRAQPAPAAPGIGPAVPVSVATVRRQDVPIWLRGLGAVQAFNAVTVRARVDGTLTKVPVTEGQEVKQGDLLAVIDPRPFQVALDVASAKRQQDQAQLANAQADLARYSSLARQDFASRQQVDTQQAQVKQLTAAIAGDTAQVEAAQLNLGFCAITAPFDGRVGLRSIDPGNLVHATDATGIMTLTQIHPIAVTFTLPQDDLPRVNAAMAARRLPVLAFAGNDATELDRGMLLTPDNTIDPSTGTIRLKAVFPNQRNQLWPGQFVNARLLLKTEPNVLTVPSVAVQHGPAGLYVYVVTANATVARHDVRVERDDGRLAVIAQGLLDGQIVVTNGQSRLQDGTRVAVDSKPTAAATAQMGG